MIVCLSSFFSLCSDFSPSPFKGEVFLSSLVKIGASSSSLSSSPLSLSLLVLVLLVLVYVSSEEKESKVVRERGRGREEGKEEVIYLQRHEILDLKKQLQLVQAKNK